MVETTYTLPYRWSPRNRWTNSDLDPTLQESRDFNDNYFKERYRWVKEHGTTRGRVEWSYPRVGSEDTERGQLVTLLRKK